MDSPTLWLLADDRIGNVNQCLGVAEVLAVPVTRKNIVYTRWASLPNMLRGASLLGVDREKSDALTGPYPDIVIAAGRKTAPIARYLKKVSAGQSMTVQLMWPGFPVAGLDLIAAPQHDDLPTLAAGQLLTTVGAAHRVTAARLEVERAAWQERIAAYPSPHVAVLIGGTTKDHTITEAHIQHLGEQLSAMVWAQGGSVLVSTSRRTDASVVAALKKAISVPCYFYEWTPEGANPYFAFLAASDRIVVTGDSMSMCSEACATGKPVYIFAPNDSVSPKHSRLHAQLYARRFAKPFTGEWGETWHYQPLDVAGEIAASIRARLSL